jgi:hypothetical protein
MVKNGHFWGLEGQILGSKWPKMGSGGSNLGSGDPKMGPEGQIWGQGTQKWGLEVKNRSQRVKMAQNDPNLGSKSGSKVKVGANKGFQPQNDPKGQFWGENGVLTRILSQKSNWQTQNPQKRGFWGWHFAFGGGFDKDFWQIEQVRPIWWKSGFNLKKVKRKIWKDDFLF